MRHQSSYFSSGFLTRIHLFLLLFTCSHAIKANWDITVTVTAFTLKDDDDGNDIYISFWMKRPEADVYPGKIVSIVKTEVSEDQPEGSHPHEGFSFTFIHHDPIQLEVYVKDEDTVWDDVLLGEIWPLPVGQTGVFNKTFSNDLVSISLKVEIRLSKCGANELYCSQTIPPPVFQPNQPIPVLIQVHPPEGAPSMDALMVSSEIRQGFIGELGNAQPAPANVAYFTTNDGLPDGFRVDWNLDPTAPGEHVLSYEILPSSSLENWLGKTVRTYFSGINAQGIAFANRVAHAGNSDEIIGPNDDCNGNGAPDTRDIFRDPSLDADGDFQIDYCSDQYVETNPFTLVSIGAPFTRYLKLRNHSNGLDIRHIAFRVEYNPEVLQFLEIDTVACRVEQTGWDTEWYKLSDSSFLVSAYGTTLPLEIDPDQDLLRLSFLPTGFVHSQDLKVLDFTYNNLAERTLPIDGGTIVTSVENPIGSIPELDWEIVWAPNSGVSASIRIFPASDVSIYLELYAANGQALQTVWSGRLTPGEHSLRWDVPTTLAAGIYFMSLQTEQGWYWKKISIGY